MYNFLRLKSLRIPVLPGAEVSAWFGEKLTNQRSTTAESKSQSLKKLGNRVCLSFESLAVNVCIYTE
jgi:hypothetical protein